MSGETSALHAWAEAAKRRTDSGAVMAWDEGAGYCEFYIKPKWLISKNRVAYRKGSCTFNIWEKCEGEDPNDVLSEIRPKVRFLVDAP